MKKLRPAYACVLPATPEPVPKPLWSAVWEATLSRARERGECHWREALPQILYNLVHSCHPSIRAAVGAALLEQDRRSGSPYKYSIEANRITARVASDVRSGAVYKPPKVRASD